MDMDRLERLEGLVEDLVREVQCLRDVLERLFNRKLRLEGGKVLSLRELGEDELWVVKEFLDWMRENWRDWVRMYEDGYTEGVDNMSGRVCLKKGTIEEFLERVCERGYMRRDVLRVLGDVGLLRYRDIGKGQRQYCIAVRIRKPLRAVVSRYVVDVERAKEVSQELKSLLEAKERVRGAVLGVEEAEEFSDIEE